MIPGLFMWPGMVGGRRSVAAMLSAYPNLAAYFEAGLGESTDPGPPVKVSQLVSPIYVDPGGGAIDAPRKYIQTIDQATFASMPLRDTTGWGGGLEAIKGDGATYYMNGSMAAAMAPPFGFLTVADNTSSGTNRRFICSTTSSVGPYLTTTDYLAYYDGAGSAVISDAALSTGKHVILVLVTTTTVQAWIDGVAQTAVSVSSPNFGSDFKVLTNSAASASFVDGDLRSLGLYLGNWTTDGTRAGLESFLNSRAGGGLI